MKTILVTIALLSALRMVAQSVSIELPPAGRQGPPLLTGAGPTNRVIRLETSNDLRVWNEVGRAHDRLDAFPDLGFVGDSRRFYRTLSTAKSSMDDWKNQVRFESDGFRSAEPQYGKLESRWIKFAIRLADPNRVYFQDSGKYAFHYDFAVQRLPGYSGLSRAEFDAISLRTNRQEVLLGAVLFSPTTNVVEYGIQFVGLDAYPRESVAAWYRTVDAMIGRPPEARGFYLPTFEQSGVARDHAGWLALQGVQVASADRWLVSDEGYSTGWAYGRLVWVPAGEIGNAYAVGALRPDDILLTDAVPAEVPPLAGIVSLSPATPNSHVALLAQSFGIPFVYFADAAFREELRNWAGRLVMLRAVQYFGGGEVFAAPLSGELPAELQAELEALRRPPPLALTPKERLGRFTVAADGLHPADLRHVGGKAANFGVLRRSVPAAAPSPAIAITFDLWDDYLDQILPGGPTLRAAISQRLGGFAWPPNMSTLQTALAEVRELVEDVADFTPSQRTAILEALQQAGFTPDRKIRFRSSTNVEDAEKFSGAGLYESFSGCLADELDGDNTGPSRCDPDEARERGVFRAIRKVYASFHRDNAFLERLRHEVDESQVGMAILVHYSTPDPEEMANGVATLDVWKDSRRSVNATLVTQAGAVSVANPDSTARPERVTGSSYDGSPFFLTVEDRSSLVPLGDTVLDWDDEYHALLTLLNQAAKGFETEYPTRNRFVLDLEYKKVVPGSLQLKQIREVPQFDPTATLPAYLLGTEELYGVLQGEHGDLVANHRLKSLWNLRVRHCRLAGTDLERSVFGDVQIERREGTNASNWEGLLSGLPGYSFARTSEGTVERWSQGEGDQHQKLSLRTFLPERRPAGMGPLTVLGDHRLEFTVNYSKPQPTLGWEPAITNTLQEFVLLGPVQRPTAESLPQRRELKLGAMTVVTRFYWPAPPKGIAAGYTAPLQAWVETVIQGLTTDPIVLRGDFAQTYRPGHHNFSEEFVFDPWLEPGIASAILEELASKNVRAVLLSGNPWDSQATGYVWGLDGRIRPF